jgi:hypothetical protein
MLALPSFLRAATGVALYLLVAQLRAIIEMSLLRELGFSCDRIDAILEAMAAIGPFVWSANKFRY